MQLHMLAAHKRCIAQINTPQRKQLLRVLVDSVLDECTIHLLVRNI